VTRRGGSPAAWGRSGRELASSGVLLVALGAAIWGTGTVLRAPLSAAFAAPVLLVLAEHLVLALYAVPAVWRGRREMLSLDLPRWAASWERGSRSTPGSRCLFSYHPGPRRMVYARDGSLRAKEQGDT
jgi:hypothetical protein